MGKHDVTYKMGITLHIVVIKGPSNGHS